MSVSSCQYHVNNEHKYLFSFCKDKQHEALFYQIEAPETLTNQSNDQESVLQSIAELFAIIEQNKESLKLETYSLSQTSLEQVFLSFAREQKAIENKF